MTRVIHLGTKIQTVFGLLDDAGNVTQRYPAEASLDTLDPARFTEVCQGLVDARDKLEAEQCPLSPVE